MRVRRAAGRSCVVRVSPVASSSSAAHAATTIMTACVRALPSATINTKLVAREPKIAPAVFAAYSAPTARRGSPAVGAAAASASGKLAPQSSAAGSTAYAVRSRSSSSVMAAVVGSVTSIGQ